MLPLPLPKLDLQLQPLFDQLVAVSVQHRPIGLDHVLAVRLHQPLMLYGLPDSLVHLKAGEGGVRARWQDLGRRANPQG